MKIKSKNNEKSMAEKSCTGIAIILGIFIFTLCCFVVHDWNDIYIRNIEIIIITIARLIEFINIKLLWKNHKEKNNGLGI